MFKKAEENMDMMRREEDVKKFKMGPLEGKNTILERRNTLDRIIADETLQEKRLVNMKQKID